MTIVYALLAALGNALNVITAHTASVSAPPRSGGRRFVVYLVRSPLWRFGWSALAEAFVFQVLALHSGQMSVVQPLLVTDLVFALVLRRFWIRQSIRRDLVGRGSDLRRARGVPGNVRAAKRPGLPGQPRPAERRRATSTSSLSARTGSPGGDAGSSVQSLPMSLKSFRGRHRNYAE